MGKMAPIGPKFRPETLRLTLNSSLRLPRLSAIKTAAVCLEQSQLKVGRVVESDSRSRAPYRRHPSTGTPDRILGTQGREETKELIELIG